MPVPVVAILCAVLLVAVGLGGYLTSDAKNPVTALIPAGVGILLLVPGILSLVAPNLRKHGMHAAAMIGVIGLLLACVGLGRALATGSGTTLSRLCIAAMAVICAAFVAVCVKSFRDARRNRLV